MATIKSKLIANAIIVLLTVVAIIGMEYHELNVLKNLQDQGAQRADNAILAGTGARVGLSLSSVISGAIINRDLDEVAKSWPETKEKNFKRLDEVEKAADTKEEKEWAVEAKKAAVEVANIFENKTLPLLRSTTGITKEIIALDEASDKQVQIIRENMLKIEESIRKEAKEADKEYDAEIRKTITESLIIGLIGILLQMGLAGWLLNSILKPVTAMVTMFRDMAQGEGDLTQRLNADSKDEIAVASGFFNQFVEKLHRIISSVAGNTSQVAAAATQLMATAEQIATGAEEVAAQAGTVATAGEEMSATSGDIAQNCQMAAEGSNQASQAASSGSAVVNNTVQVMSRIASRVQETAKTVESLGARSDQIGAIVATIQDIADQTNLLALNAAIEAARAGEQGRGFAVVADEVRALAERTTKATREISEMIKAIQNETKGAVAAMEAGVQEVEQGTMEAAKSGTALQEILEQINAVTMQVNQVATAAEEQTATTGEISNNIHQITEVVQETAKGAQESATAANQLARTAEELQRIVGQFKL
ncbi:methyl-accepting chemotaxis protein [Geobacter pelophilus]|uniref:Methyl-accepting chemotaxis protein n=1 Tax=Geoanaerobacter pelophilus TaxID=60036 RepID=A0AAW4KXU8_9BACT|nr:HAMP domain-containing methyl-accepting chemotaxis protein [Geoanaerobacter pelophilus]MBT0663453.1 methyl-accepting chemotaxis protein [Geoanaerobacter pelophilus]